MASSLASFGLRGFSALSVLSHIKRRWPQYANAITAAQVAGYSGANILRALDWKKKPEEEYLTESEKAYKNYAKQKKKAAYQAAGILAAAGGLGYAATRTAARAGMQVLPALAQSAQGKTPVTLQHPQGLLPYMPNQRPNPNNPQGPTQPIQPRSQPPAPMAPQGQPPQAPNQPPQQSPTLATNIALVKNLRQEKAIENFFKQGMDPLLAASVLRDYTIPKHIAKLLDKSEGGLDQVVQDYYQYLEQNPPQERPQFSRDENFGQGIIQQAHQQEQQMQPPEEAPIQTPASLLPQPSAPIEPIIKPIKQIVPDIEKEIVAKLPMNIVNTPLGIGKIDHDGKSGIIANVDGKKKSFKHDQITKPPQDLEEAVRHIINSIPENEKSTNLQSATYVPLPNGNNVMIVKFYDGKVAWYVDVPEDIYDNIAQGTYAPKTTGKTGIGEYKPSVVDSRGAGFSSEIARHPKYSKDNKGKTWGYAKNDYDAFKMIQPIVHKISKEKLDAQGNVIQPKKRNR